MSDAALQADLAELRGRFPETRALYRQVDLGQQIPEEFFQAVAEVLAFVYRTAGRGRQPLKRRTKRPITGPHALQQASP